MHPRWSADFLESDLALGIGAMGSEFGVLPSVVIFGSAALENRHAWHVGFDYAVWLAFVKHRSKIQEENRAGGKPQYVKNLIRSGRAGNVGTGVNLPDPAPFKRG